MVWIQNVLSRGVFSVVFHCFVFCIAPRFTLMGDLMTITVPSITRFLKPCVVESAKKM